MDDIKWYFISVIIGIALGSFSMSKYRDYIIQEQENKTLVTEHTTRAKQDEINTEVVQHNETKKNVVRENERMVIKHVKEFVNTGTMPAEYASLYNNSLMLSESTRR